MIDILKILNLNEVITLEKIIYIISLPKLFIEINFLCINAKASIISEKRTIKIINLI